MRNNSLYIILLILVIQSCTTISTKTKVPIDRDALVHRNNVLLNSPDTLGSLTVGNGEFAFTVDITGLQTFPEYYENGIPLGTQSQWGWHSFPNTDNYKKDDVSKLYETCNDHQYPVAIQHKEGRAAEATHYLRTSPHRLHLGLIGFELQKEDGTTADMEDIQNISQELDMWTGKITSHYTIEDTPVKVELYSHQDRDQISFQVTSGLIKEGRLKVKLAFPYGNDCHVCPGYDWNHPERHTSKITAMNDNSATIDRKLDNEGYFTSLLWTGEGKLNESAKHHFLFTPAASTQFSFNVLFTQDKPIASVSTFVESSENSTHKWKEFWSNGGAIDFSACSDPRAQELERRVVLSQYLTAIQCAGQYPPQETGLTMNSWYGKFHLEMHWWHGVHFPLWNRVSLLEKSFDWYPQVMDVAEGTAQWQGFEGVRWPKMTGPKGVSSPSSVGEFLVWQQPHPIYFAELIYRDNPSSEILQKYQDIVFRTATFMASFAQYNSEDGKYHLCHPLIPAQEIFPATETDDPPFEVAYWYYALNVAQDWKERMGLPRVEKWDEVLENLTPLHKHEDLYLPAARAFNAYTDDSNRRDHPIVTGAYGMLPLSEQIDTSIMLNTLREIMKKWNWETTWGWDYPMLAMCAARLGKGEMAIDALLMNVQKNTYLVNGHNYQDSRLRLYLPGNGGLLTAVAMMAAGWDNGPNIDSPGFPKNGKWEIKWENLKKMP